LTGLGETFFPDAAAGLGETFFPDAAAGLGATFFPDEAAGLGETFFPDEAAGLGETFFPDEAAGLLPSGAGFSGPFPLPPDGFRGPSFLPPGFLPAAWRADPRNDAANARTDAAVMMRIAVVMRVLCG
jgi:hypothetical protein